MKYFFYNPDPLQMAVKQTLLTIAGLEVNVYSSSTSNNEKPAVVFFYLHGRFGSAVYADPTVRAIIEQVQSLGPERELLVITFVSKTNRNGQDTRCMTLIFLN